MQYINKTNKKNFTHNAFTMIEMVFVIVILGILAAIAVPRLSATRTDATITKGRSDIASIRSAIITERQSRLIQGDSSFIATGAGAGQLDDGGLFGGVLTYAITDSATEGHWTQTARDVNTTTYKFKILNIDNIFVYQRSDGSFNCTAGTYCSALTD